MYKVYKVIFTSFITVKYGITTIGLGGHIMHVWVLPSFHSFRVERGQESDATLLERLNLEAAVAATALEHDAATDLLQPHLHCHIEHLVHEGTEFAPLKLRYKLNFYQKSEHKYSFFSK